MTKQQLVDKMEARYGAFILPSQIAEFMGLKDRHSIRKYIARLERVGNRYFVPDVAKEIMEHLT